MNSAERHIPIAPVFSALYSHGLLTSLLYQSTMPYINHTIVLDNWCPMYYSKIVMIFRPSTRRGSFPFLLFISLAASLLIVGNGAASVRADMCSMSKAAGPTGKELLSRGCCCENRQAGQGGPCVDLKARCASDQSAEATVSLPSSVMGSSPGLGPALSTVSPEVLAMRADRPDTSLSSQTVYLANLCLLR